MGSMRQRLLLVAGWATAAVVASLVSAGAVAVAGGQVADRPLRPLSATEVAALTKECGISERAPCLRQLDNSGGPSTTVVAAPDLSLGLDGDEQGVSPTTGSEEELNPELDESLLVPEDDAAVPEPRGEVISLEGGSLGVSGADGEVKIIWVLPGPGYALLPPTGTEIEEGSVTLVFSDGSHQSMMIAKWDSEEGLVVETTESVINLTES